MHTGRTPKEICVASFYEHMEKAKRQCGETEEDGVLYDCGRQNYIIKV